jgi:GxxExxY protein
MNRHDAKNAKFREPEARIDTLARAVLDCAFEVHRLLGPGFLESVYEEALAVELALRHLPFTRQTLIGVEYKGKSVGQARLDLLVGGELVVELKVVEQFAPIHTAQVLSHLKATGRVLGLLINFNVGELRRGIRRIVHSSSLGVLGDVAVGSPNAK